MFNPHTFHADTHIVLNFVFEKNSSVSYVKAGQVQVQVHVQVHVQVQMQVQVQV